jgi:hypothetical protein
MFALCINILTPAQVGQNLLNKAEEAVNTVLLDSTKNI